MKNRVLFVTEKWCEGNPSVGWTNNFHNLFNTFQQCRPDCSFNTLHIDESMVVFGKHIDEVLPKYCLQWDVNIVFFCLLGNSPMNPSMGVFQQLKDLGIKLCFIWPDSGPGWAVQTMYALEKLATVQITWDRAVSAYHSQLPPLSNLLYLWAPEDDSLYFVETPILERQHGITFIGSRYYAERQATLAYLKEKIPNLFVTGGQREDKLSPQRYAQIIRQSKIILNFPNHPLGFTQLKSRVIESFACGALVIELKNGSTSQLFKPQEEYVEAESLNDMVDKVYFYLDHPQEMAIIAGKGQQKYLTKYTAQHYWDEIFKNI